MRAASREFQKRLGQRAQDALCASPELQAHYQAECRARRPSLWELVLNCIGIVMGVPMCLTIPIAVCLIGHAAIGVDGMLGVHSLLFWIAASVLTIGMRSWMKCSKILSLASHLPVADHEVASRVWWDWALIALPLLYVNLCFYGVVGWQHAWGPVWVGFLFTAAAQWLGCLATATILAAYIRPRTIKISLILVVIALVAYCCLDPALRSDTTWILLRILPTGWLNGWLGRGVVQGQLVEYWSLVAVAAWWLWGLRSFAILKSAYRVDDLMIGQGTSVEATARTSANQAINPAAEELIWHTSLTSQLIDDEEVPQTLSQFSRRIRSREFLEKQDWQALGWIERLVDRWLTPRERVIVEFVTSEQLQWTKLWLGLLFTIPVLYALQWWNGQPLPTELTIFVLIAPGIMSSMGPWPAFRSRASSGVYAPQFASMPLGYDEVFTALMKVTAVRCLASLGLLLVACIPLAAGLPANPIDVALTGFGILAWNMVSILWLLVGQMELGSAFPNMNWRNAIRCLALKTLPLIVFFSLYCLMIGGMVAQSRWRLLTASTLLIVCSIAGLLLSRWLYLSGATDLVRGRRRDLDQLLDSFEQSHIDGVRRTELFKKYGWFYWLKRELPHKEVTS